MKKRILSMLVLLVAVVTGAWAQGAKHLITATYREQTRSLEQPLPYATTIGELYEAVSGESFSYLISAMSAVEMPLTGISSRNTSVVSIGELNGASTPVTVKADGEAIINLIFGSYVQGIFVSAISPLYANMKDGVKDADKWTVKVGEGDAQALPIGGLKGDGSETVTLQYTGRLKVKGVKATSDAAPAEPSVPDGAINGKFSVSDGKQVYFSKGNLQATYNGSNWSWAFATNQWDCIGNAAGNTSINGNGSVSAAGTVDLFGWSTAATTYGIHNSTTASDYSGDFVDWGGLIGTGWRTLTKDEWDYLFMTRESGSKVNGMSPSPDNARYTHATINTDNGTGGIRGMILFPDGVTVNYSDATSWGGINQYSNWNGSTKCTTSQWNALAAKGFVFLPTGGVRNGTTISNSNNNGYYWSSYTASPTSGSAYYTRVVASTEPTTASDSRKIGISVRLVREVATSDAPAPAWDLTAKLAYTGGEIADFTDATDDLTTMTWAVGEHIAILYEVSGTKKVADAEITAVDGTTGAATITFTVEAGTPNDTPCTLVYPYDAAKDDHTGVKDAATLLANQDGTLNANLDVRVGAGTIQTTTPGLTVTTQPEAQFAIFKFTTKSVPSAGGSLQNTNVTKLTVTIGAQDYVITSASATSTLYAALPAVSGQTVSFTATGGSNLYAASKASVSFDAAKYYQSTVKMGKVIEVFEDDDPILEDFTRNPSYKYLHIGLEQAYAIARQLSTQNSGATVAVVYNNDNRNVTYALSSDASATERTLRGDNLFENNYRVFLATLWEDAD